MVKRQCSVSEGMTFTEGDTMESSFPFSAEKSTYIYKVCFYCHFACVFCIRICTLANYDVKDPLYTAHKELVMLSN